VRAETHGLEVDWQDDDGKTVAKAAQCAGGVRAESIGISLYRAAEHVSSPLKERDNAWLRAADRAIAGTRCRRRKSRRAPGVQEETLSILTARTMYSATRGASRMQ